MVKARLSDNGEFVTVTTRIRMFTFDVTEADQIACAIQAAVSRGQRPQPPAPPDTIG